MRLDLYPNKLAVYAQRSQLQPSQQQQAEASSSPGAGASSSSRMNDEVIEALKRLASKPVVSACPPPPHTCLLDRAWQRTPSMRRIRSTITPRATAPCRLLPLQTIRRRFRRRVEGESPVAFVGRRSIIQAVRDQMHVDLPFEVLMMDGQIQDFGDYKVGRSPAHSASHQRPTVKAA
jgi:hypothetical protein